jgi:hypothetical protein
VVGFTTGSRGEVPGKRKPVIREHNNNKYTKTPGFEVSQYLEL